MNRLKKGDDVIVLAGKDKGKRGTVEQVFKNDKVLVENINIVKKHVKPNPNKGVTGGIIEKSMPIHSSNVALFDSNEKKAGRVGIKMLDDNRKVRFFVSSGEVID